MNVLRVLSLIILCGLSTEAWAQAVSSAREEPSTPGGAKAGQAQPFAAKPDLLEELDTGEPSGFLQSLNELFAPKEVLLDVTRFGSGDLRRDALLLGSSAALTGFAIEDGDDAAFGWGPETLDDVSDSLSLLGSRVFMYPALISSFYVGKATDRPGLSRTAAQMTQALMLTDLLVMPLKMAVGRTRPDGSDSYSFPSGHTAGAFAIATVLNNNYGPKVGLPAYAFASLMGAARIDERRHFLSDVVAGAAIGYFAASAVNRRFGGREVNVHVVRSPSGGRGIGFTIRF